jgi:hypothetical protein
MYIQTNMSHAIILLAAQQLLNFNKTLKKVKERYFLF